MVFHLGLYLVELDYFKKVSFVFLVTGHTKNSCDRWFNMLKQHYRKTNIYTYKQLIDVFQHPEITVETMDPEQDFRNWDKFENTFYKERLDNGSIKDNHIFYVESDKKGVLQIRRDDLPESPPVPSQEFVKNVKNAYNQPDRLEKLRAGPEVELSKGLPEIKQVELYEKFRPLLPKQFRNETCPYPGDEIWNAHKEKAKAKAKAKAKEKAQQKREMKAKEDSGSPPKKHKNSSDPT